MTALLKKEKRYSPEEYLGLEENADFRSEYENGGMIAMAGDSLNHQQIISNIVVFLGSELRKKGCRTLPSEMKVWIESIQRVYYPVHWTLTQRIIACKFSIYFLTSNQT